MSHLRSAPRPPQRAARLARRVGGAGPARRALGAAPALRAVGPARGRLGRAGRRRDRALRAGVGALRPAGPDDRRDLRDRVVPRPAPLARPAARRRHGLHRHDAAARSARPASRSTTGCCSPTRTTRAAPASRCTGTFRTAPANGAARACGSCGRATWRGRAGASTRTSAATAIYEEMRRAGPGLLPVQRRHHLRRRPDRGDASTLPDGGTWRNITTEEKSKVAETLAEFRGNFRYNLLDENLRRFNAQVPVDRPVGRPRGAQQLVPGRDPRRRPLHREERRRARGARAAGLQRVLPDLARCGRARDGRVLPGAAPRPAAGRLRARHAHVPQRQLPRHARPTTPQGILGAEQLEWLKRELSRSRAVWKVIASDMPLGLVVPDGDGKPNFEAVAQGDPGAPLGRELQIAELLRYIKHRRITGTVWLTADVHYTSAQHYAPVAGGLQGLRAVLGVRLGPAERGRLPGERAGRHLRPRAGRSSRRRPRRTSRRRGLPVLRRGRHRRRQRGADGAAARAGRHGAVHQGAPAGPGRPVTRSPLSTDASRPSISGHDEKASNKKAAGHDAFTRQSQSVRDHATPSFTVAA